MKRLWVLLVPSITICLFVAISFYGYRNEFFEQILSIPFVLYCTAVVIGIASCAGLLFSVFKLQDEMDNDLHTQRHPDKEIRGSVALEQGSSGTPREKSQQSHSKEMPVHKTEDNMDMKTKRIVQKLLLLGKQYGSSANGNNTIESHHQFSCRMADGTTRDIVVVLREQDISVFCRPNPPQRFEGNHQVDDALKEVERLLKNSN
jgi:hypothetical protein